MISRRKLFSMTLMMGVLFLLFMLTQLYRVSVNDYDTNPHAAEEPGAEASAAFDPLSDSAWTDAEEGEGRQVVFIGRAGAGMDGVVSQWCAYSKRALARFSTLKDYLAQEKIQGNVLCLDPGSVYWESDGPLLVELANRNLTIIFGGLPEEQELVASPAFRRLLGIEGLREPGGVDLEGIYLYSGFLIGGDAVYRADSPEEAERQDLELRVPWYQLDSQTKVYLAGLLPGEDTGRDRRPPLIWRNTVERARVFAVVGDYLLDETGLGILEAVMAESSSFDLYPVVNAQCLSVAHYPSFASENQEELQRIYSSGLKMVAQNIIWPSLLSISEQSGFKMTCFMTPQFLYQDQEEPDTDSLTFYLQQIRDRQGEAGWSSEGTDGVSTGEKWSRDSAFLREAGSGYVFTAAYAPRGGAEELAASAAAGEAPAVRTITGEAPEGGDLLSFASEGVTFQGITHWAERYRYSDDLRNRSLQTALGYTNILLDVRRVLWPEEESDQWEHYSQEASGNIGTWWRTYGYFDKTTASEADSRVRDFLTLDYTAARENNVITLRVENLRDTASFLLRTHDRQVSSVSGGSFFRIEKDAYLITASEEQVRINLTN